MASISLEQSSLTRLKGIAMAFGGASLWGLSGSVAQVLFAGGISPAWLVTIRLLSAGFLLLLYVCLRSNIRIASDLWKNPRDRKQLIIFGLVGMLGVQYTYFAAVATGNAATATLLQFLGPVFITLYLAIRLRRRPDRLEIGALGLALIGTYLLITNGSLEGLSITPAALGWGLLSALTAAFYTLYPAQLLQKWGSMAVVGWGMLLGGIGLSMIVPPWSVDTALLTGQNLLYIFFVVIFGTLIPFYMVLESLRYISPAEVGMLNSAEPLSAVVVSVIWLQLSIGWFEAIGGLCIISTVILLALNQQKTKPKEKSTP